jgi:soluble lytic murein transglycosylase-like protein
MVLDLRSQIRGLLNSECKRRRLDPHLIAAIIAVESSWNPWAVRYEPDFRYFDSPAKWAKFNHITVDTEIQLQKQSFGLMQIMGGSARSIGFTGPLTMLLDPVGNVVWGCEFFEKRCSLYSTRESQIAAYNAGTPRYDSTGKFINQAYVEKVKLAYMKDIEDVGTGSVG